LDFANKLIWIARYVSNNFPGWWLVLMVWPLLLATKK
jgi:hypothetical protein